MNDSIKVMLCDDSSTMRRIIKEALKIDPRLCVVYEAKNGQEAVDNLDSAEPDIVVMDVEMPVMDGIDATREIRRLKPSLPVVMFSSLTSRGAEATLDALSAGASDFAVKPASSGHIGAALGALRAELVPKLLHLSAKKIAREVSASQATAATKTSASVQSQLQNITGQRVDAIAIGVSTGGPDALSKLLSDLPKNVSAPIFIAQHMPPVFTSLLAARLASRSGLDVSEAVDGEVVKPGRVILAPGDFHLTVGRSGTSVKVQLNQEPAENSCRPAVDPLFRSVANCYGQNALGIVLTGMGQDGTLGAADIKSKGGKIIVQDQASSVVWGMPGKVFSAGHADQVLPLCEIAPELARRVSRQAIQAV